MKDDGALSSLSEGKVVDKVQAVIYPDSISSTSLHHYYLQVHLLHVSFVVTQRERGKNVAPQV